MVRFCRWISGTAVSHSMLRWFRNAVSFLALSHERPAKTITPTNANAKMLNNGQFDDMAEMTDPTMNSASSAIAASICGNCEAGFAKTKKELSSCFAMWAVDQN